MELKLGIEVLESYKRLSYKAWYALAEYVDNSTQSYINNSDLLDKVFEKEATNLQVIISYNNDATNGYVKIEDNSIGMDDVDLERALTVGRKPDDPNGRSKYGLGLKTASFWFGDKWEIVTKKYGHEFEYTVTADLDILTGKKSNPASNNSNAANLAFNKSEPLDKELHYTKITITKLNRKIAPATSRKIKDFLRSIYRVDLQNHKLSLIFQDEHLRWDKSYFIDRLVKDENGVAYHTTFDFEILGKRVHGWAGVLESGSRRDGGFSILQANRVIQGWPDAYRPTKLFGDQEGGINDLANQRLTGELYLDGFDVSHTKDEILFSEDEEDRLNDKLFEILAIYKKAANEYRKPIVSSDGTDNVDYESIVEDIFKEVKKPKVANSVIDTFVLPKEIIKDSNEEVYERTLQLELNEVYTTEVSGISITVIINSESSSYDPYLIIRSRAEKDRITIIVNKNHIHWKSLKSSEMVMYFLKHVVLDGLAEWKAHFIAGDLDPDTIKNIKDSYLRLNIDVI